MRVVTVGRLVLHVRGRNRNAALPLLRRIINRIKRTKLYLRIVLRQYLRDRRRQRRLAVINVPNRPHVHVRLGPVKLLLRHLVPLSCFKTFTTSELPSGLRPGHFQPSLSGLIVFSIPTQDYVLGYSQPSLSGLTSEPTATMYGLKPVPTSPCLPALPTVCPDTKQNRAATSTALTCHSPLSLAGKAANPPLPHRKTGKPPVQHVVGGRVVGQKHIQS